MVDPVESAKEEIKKLARIGNFFKDYGIIIGLFKGLLWFVVWSSGVYHENIARINRLEMQVEQLIKADETKAAHINTLGKSYAHLTNTVYGIK